MIPILLHIYIPSLLVAGLCIGAAAWPSRSAVPAESVPDRLMAGLWAPMGALFHIFLCGSFAFLLFCLCWPGSIVLLASGHSYTGMASCDAFLGSYGVPLLAVLMLIACLGPLAGGGWALFRAVSWRRKGYVLRQEHKAALLAWAAVNLLFSFSFCFLS